MNISKMNKAEILAVLYNRARPGSIFDTYDNRMSTAQAQELLNTGQTYFDYLEGRSLKIDLSGDELVTAKYNRDNGKDAAEIALSHLTSRGC